MNAKDYNPFKMLNDREKLPEEHKAKVLETINTFQFILDVADLFTVKQVAINTEMAKEILKGRSNDSDNKGM